MKLDNVWNLCFILGSMVGLCGDLRGWLRVEDIYQEVAVLDAHHRSWLKGSLGLESDEFA